MNFNDKEIRNDVKTTFHLWDFSDTIYFLIKPEARKIYFNKIYSFYGNKRKAAKNLELSPKTIRTYEDGFSVKHKIKHPQYIPARFFKKTLHIFDLEFLENLEKNVEALSVRNGLDVKNPKLPISESPELYSIIVHMIADGSASKRCTPYYGNSCQSLRDNFKTNLNIFGEAEISESKVGGTIGVNFPKAITDILSHCFNIAFTHPNKLPSQIFTASLECKKAFLQALFDDEGTISTNLIVGIHNISIMEEIKALINSIGIETGNLMIHPYPYKKDKITLRIPTKEYIKFKDLIGFSHPQKAANLEIAIQRKNREQRTRDMNYIEERILRILELKPSKTMELANELLFTINGINPHLKRMLNDGLITKRGYKNEFIWDIV